MSSRPILTGYQSHSRIRGHQMTSPIAVQFVSSYRWSCRLTNTVLFIQNSICWVYIGNMKLLRFLQISAAKLCVIYAALSAKQILDDFFIAWQKIPNGHSLCAATIQVGLENQCSSIWIFIMDFVSKIFQRTHCIQRDERRSFNKLYLFPSQVLPILFHASHGLSPPRYQTGALVTRGVNSKSIYVRQTFANVATGCLLTLTTVDLKTCVLWHRF